MSDVVTPQAGTTSIAEQTQIQIQQRMLGLILGAAVLGLLVAASLAVGSRSIALGEVWEALTNYDRSNDEHLVVRELRVPRTVLGLVVGAALGVAGAVMQALTRNPLAEPGILGVNAGASAAVAVAIALGATTVLSYVWFSFAGAALAGALVYVLGGASHSGSNPVRLTLAGAALSVVLGSFTKLLLINYPQTFLKFRFWAVGGIQGRDFDVIVPISVFVAIGLIIAFSLARSLDSVALGSETSRALGASPNKVWAGAAVCVVLLSGAASAAAGPIGFVGLTAPHVARSVVGTQHRWVLPYSMMVAAGAVLGADVAGRMVIRPGEISTGIMTALIGGPFFVMLVRRKRIAQL